MVLGFGAPSLRWDEAAADYQAVLAVAPDDPSAWNNLGNTNMVGDGGGSSAPSAAPAVAGRAEILVLGDGEPGRGGRACWVWQMPPRGGGNLCVDMYVCVYWRPGIMCSSTGW